MIAWDGHGRVFMGSESSDDPAGTAKTFGDVWVARYVNPVEAAGGDPDASGVDTAKDGLVYSGTKVVASGSSAPGFSASSTTRPRSRPTTQAAVAMGRLLRLGAL